MNMMDYIREQPDVFARALANRASLAAPFVELFRAVEPDRLYIVASGTSRNASATAAPFMSQVLGMDVTVSAPSRLYAVYGQRPLMIYVSQGGNSTNTIAAMERFAAIPSLAMTGDRGRICDLCQHYTAIPCGPETVGPKTKGYTMTILGLYLLALETARATGRLSEADYETYMSTLTAAGGQCRIYRCLAEGQRRGPARAEGGLSGGQGPGAAHRPGRCTQIAGDSVDPHRGLRL